MEIPADSTPAPPELTTEERNMLFEDDLLRMVMSRLMPRMTATLNSSGVLQVSVCLYDRKGKMTFVPEATMAIELWKLKPQKQPPSEYYNTLQIASKF